MRAFAVRIIRHIETAFLPGGDKGGRGSVDGELITIYAGHADHTDTESLIAIVPYGKRSSAAGAFEANGSKVRVV